MKYAWLILGWFPVVAQAPEPDVSKLAFMTGCWEMQAGPMTIQEQWTKPAGGTMLGVGRTIKGTKTVFTEFQKISVEKGKITYTARIGTPGVTLFPAKSVADSDVIFENLAHDFPHRVIYRKSESGLFARIEGTDKGKERHEDFPYRRVACE